jgi:hypothetical protein
MMAERIRAIITPFPLAIKYPTNIKRPDNDARSKISFKVFMIFLASRYD